jgi:hypothetical protein
MLDLLLYVGVFIVFLILGFVCARIWVSIFG